MYCVLCRANVSIVVIKHLHGYNSHKTLIRNYVHIYNFNAKHQQIQILLYLPPNVPDLILQKQKSALKSNYV